MSRRPPRVVVEVAAVVALLGCRGRRADEPARTAPADAAVNQTVAVDAAVAGPRCRARDVASMRAEAAELALMFDDNPVYDDEPDFQRDLLIERPSGRVIRDQVREWTQPPPGAPPEREEPQIRIGDDGDFVPASGYAGGIPEGPPVVEVCPPARPCVTVLPHRAAGEEVTRIAVRDDGALIGFAVQRDEGHGRVEMWDVTSGRRRGRIELAELGDTAEYSVDVGFVGDRVFVLASTHRGGGRGLTCDVDGRDCRPLAGGARDVVEGTVLDLGGSRFALVRLGPEGASLVIETADGRDSERGVHLPGWSDDSKLFALGAGEVGHVYDDGDALAIVTVDAATDTARTTRVVCR